jgi:RNA polymerase sigma-70 factor (ECF subfamily)
MGTARSVGITFEQTLPAENAEAAFIAELRAGSQDAFAHLLAVYQNPVFNLVWHMVENQADASDVLQDVFVKIFKGIKGFNGESSLKTWIYRIAVHEASNHRRSWIRRHWREPVSVDDPDSPSAAAAAEAASRERRPDQVFEQAEREVVVKQALASLAPPYRTVVVLREIEGMPYEEIAQVLGLAEGTVKSRLLRGRELLRRKLASYVGKQHV